MVKVITYGTYDLLHYGHIRLLERAKALGDYLIVGVTADDFDKTRGKINVQQSLEERVAAVQATGIADVDTQLKIFSSKAKANPNAGSAVYGNSGSMITKMQKRLSQKNKFPQIYPI